MVLVEWTWGELKELEKIWMQAYKVAWHLPEQTATSIFAFPKEQGGREYPTPLRQRRPLPILPA